jgi:type IV secretory pathway VirB2 component (pilin)
MIANPSTAVYALAHIAGATLFRSKRVTARTVVRRVAIIVATGEMMKNTLAGFRTAGSFIAGILLGVSIVVLVLASTGANTTDGQTLLAFGAPIILGVGIMLQAVVTAKSRRARAVNAILTV